MTATQERPLAEAAFCRPFAAFALNIFATKLQSWGAASTVVGLGILLPLGHAGNMACLIVFGFMAAFVLRSDELMVSRWAGTPKRPASIPVRTCVAVNTMVGRNEDTEMTRYRQQLRTTSAPRPYHRLTQLFRIVEIQSKRSVV